MTAPRCHVCGAGDVVDTVIRSPLPTMQNYVYRQAAQARAATQGSLTLCVCRGCGYAWNRTFDPQLLRYDDGYDNAVPSAVMAAYYEDIARYLGTKYAAGNGCIVDIGCGNGTFLETMARVWPACRGVGVDPALPADRLLAGGRVRLVKGVFTPALLTESPALFVCRHVLEHIPDPVPFLRTLRDAAAPFGPTPLFVEVPDLGWILGARAFWDFCYEHCNYFSEASLAAVLARAGCAPTATRLGYGGQYRWMEATMGGGAEAVATDARAAAAAVERYAASERQELAAVRERLRRRKQAGEAVVVWGMATKGVIFGLLVEREEPIIDRAVDVNRNKQGSFVPGSARRIDPPAVLQEYGAQPLAIVVMNTNYLDEIRGQCAALGLAPTFLDAHGQTV